MRRALPTGARTAYTTTLRYSSQPPMMSVSPKHPALSPFASDASIAERSSAALKPRALQEDFSSWVQASSPPEELKLGLPGFTYGDLYEPERLAELTARFHTYLREHDVAAYEGLKRLEAGGGELASPVEVSNVLLAASAYLSAFVAKLFRIEEELAAKKNSILADNPIWVFKKDFVKKRIFKADAGKGWEPESARLISGICLVAAGVPREVIHTGSPDEELAVAKAVLHLLDVDETARKIAKAGGASWREELHVLAESVAGALRVDPAGQALAEATLATPQDNASPHHRAGVIASYALSAIEAYLVSRWHDPHDPAHGWPSLHEPHKLNFQHLVHIRRPNPDRPELFTGLEEHRREREGFVLTDRRAEQRKVQEQVDYCIYCHDRDKDSCSKGYHDTKTGAVKANPIGVSLHGCPLNEKISEMHSARREGDVLAALALVCIDNPLCPGTGHRICNDCMKACIYQKQEPVDIPQIETATLTDILALPWGLEIYGLLTRWNPLNVRWPHPAPLNGKNALVVGLGPAGYTLAHHLARAGFGVAGVDGLKIEPLPVELTGDETHTPRPVRDFAQLAQELDERILLGFGGVSEYGITARWDKNFLTVIYLTLARNRRIHIYGGVRFGGTMDLEDAWKLGFDHVALAAGAGRPTIIDIKNNLSRGIRKASDFLMALQLTGAYKQSSLANLQIQLPAIVIGGGLTAIDTATELLAYYVIQTQKTAERYHVLVAEKGQETVDALFDPTELNFIHEQCAHAKVLTAERAAAEAEGRVPAFQTLLDQWGGVSIAYRKSVLDSPAYRLNHEEVEKSLEEGVRYLENLSPVEALLDDTGALRAVRFERQALLEGKWRGTGEQIELPARTLCIAAGTSPNVTYERERPGVFALDAKKHYFLAHSIMRDPGGSLVAAPEKDLAQGFFTSYVKGNKTVSFYGDNHPYYAGSVVKAMASAKVGFEKVAAVYQDSTPPSEVELTERRKGLASFFQRIDEHLIARVHEVIRLTPTIVEIVIRAPAAARNFEPGQFYRLQNYESRSPVIQGTRLAMEGLALTGAWVDKEQGLLSTIVLEMGVSSRLCAMLKPGEPVVLMGPTGTPTEIPAGQTVLLCGGGLGNAVLFSIARAFKARGSTVLYFAGYRKGEDLFRQADIEASTDQVIWCTDTGEPIVPRRAQDHHFRGNIVQAMVAYARGEWGSTVAPLSSVQRLIAIGSDRMMAAVHEARRAVLAPYLNPNHIGIGSINSPMQCMMKEICAQCLQKHRDPQTGKEIVVFSCSNQDQELDRVDFQHLNQRLRTNSAQEKLTNLFLTTLIRERPDLVRI